MTTEAPSSGLEGCDVASAPSLSPAPGAAAGVGTAFTGVGAFFWAEAGVAFPPLGSAFPACFKDEAESWYAWSSLKENVSK